MTNIEKLARLIVRTGNADKIMAVLPQIITPATKPNSKEETAGSGLSSAAQPSLPPESSSHGA